ncbi:hypothetical protein CRE_21100, partial [Caenorhabditis remanei]
MAKYRVQNPATGEIVETFESATDAQVEQQLAAADTAYREWRERSVQERAAVVKRVAEIFAERREELAEIIALEMGKSIAESLDEVDFATAIIDYYAVYGPGLITDYEIPSTIPGKAVMEHLPLGVLLGVMPWNFPYYQVARFAAPNLVLGNTIILKHADICAKSNLVIQEIMEQAGVPVGGYQAAFVSHDQIATMIADPRVQGVSLTGSERAGAIIGAQAGTHLKKCVLELGGIDPMVVLDSDDVAGVAKAAWDFRTYNAGQVCNSNKRLIVMADIYDEFVAELVKLAEGLTPGDQLDLGEGEYVPLSTRAAAETVHAQVQQAVSEGARVLAGGVLSEGPAAYYSPTVDGRRAPRVRLVPRGDPRARGDKRDALTRDAIAFAESIGYENAGTVEFLLDTEGERSGEHVFIEMNPRIQVEHTVTEEVTDVDLVQAQMRIAAGATLEELGLTQDRIQLRGAALQCRITTEDPANGFRPDLGRITAYRSPGGGGVRLDGGTINPGAHISPHFDSMLAKLTCRGRDFAGAVGRAERALAEFRIRGVATNIPFLQAVLADPAFRAGDVSTSFIEERPELLTLNKPKDRATRVLQYLADVTVNQPNGARPGAIEPRVKLPVVDLDAPAPAGYRQRLLELGPEGYAKSLREQTALAVTETTFRDAHQSLLATRVRTRDLLAVAPHVARLTPQLWSVEAWGGATYDVALRFLGEDPWERLAALREALPNVPIQMLLRGQNTVGYTPYPESVARAFVREAAATGVDVFRIFDALNDVKQMRVAIDAVRESGTAVAEVAMAYTGNLLDPNEDKYTLDYYLGLADEIVGAGAHVLAIKDMAGLLRPAAAAKLVRALRERFDLPVHLHTHDTPGGQLATLLAASEAGVDAVDAASAPMSGTTSQPSLSALVAALADTERDTGLSQDAVFALEPYWDAVRTLYKPFESGLPSPTGRVYAHEIPGGQLSNLRQQAIALGLSENFEKIEDM